MTKSHTPLIDAHWLAAHLGDPDVLVFDASWYLPAQGRNAKDEFLAGHIPGARHFDFDVRFADQTSPLPHMLASPEQFEREARALGINNASLVIFYDGMGMFAAPRAWWMMRAMGHARVAVLDGGLPAWRAAGHALETGEPADPVPGDFTARPVPEMIRTAKDVLDVLGKPDMSVIDARPATRFSGAEAEARPGLRAGHMPGARNIPFSEVLDNGRFRSPAELRTVFERAGVGADDALIASCGSGVTAAIVALAAELIGYAPVPVYDGAWAEWGQEGRRDLPVVARS